MKHDETLKARARTLRTQGRSYSEICIEVPVSQSTISLWCRNIPLSRAQLNRLKRLSLEGATRARTRWSEIRRERKRTRLAELAEQARLDIGEMSRRDRFIAGLMLYAGEGDRSRERVGMSNTNPMILHFMLNWFSEFLRLDRPAFHAHLYLHEGRSLRKAKRFWSEALDISPRQFLYVYRAEIRKSHKGNVHECGVCSIRIHNVEAHRLLMSWIHAVLNPQK